MKSPSNSCGLNQSNPATRPAGHAPVGFEKAVDSREDRQADERVLPEAHRGENRIEGESPQEDAERSLRSQQHNREREQRDADRGPDQIARVEGVAGSGEIQERVERWVAIGQEAAPVPADDASLVALLAQLGVVVEVDLPALADEPGRVEEREMIGPDERPLRVLVPAAASQD